MSGSRSEAVRAYVRWMIRVDMPAVLNIERGSFESPWSEEDFLACLRQRNCIGMVAEVPTGIPGMETVAGFMVYELHKAKIDVLNLAVHPDFRKRRIGMEMVAKLQSKLADHRRTRITAMVRETNLPAQKFFLACGLRATKVVRGHYPDTVEDAYRFVYRMPVEASVEVVGGSADELEGMQ